MFLVELALGWAGEAHGLQLHGEWKLPKMRYKGSPTPQKLALVRQQQVCQVCCHCMVRIGFQGFRCILLPFRALLSAPKAAII